MTETPDPTEAETTKATTSETTERRLTIPDDADVEPGREPEPTRPDGRQDDGRDVPERDANKSEATDDDQA